MVPLLFSCWWCYWKGWNFIYQNWFLNIYGARWSYKNFVAIKISETGRRCVWFRIQKCSDWTEILYKCFLSDFLSLFSLVSQKFDLCGREDWVPVPKLAANLWRRLETSRWSNWTEILCTCFLGDFLSLCSLVFQKFDLCGREDWILVPKLAANLWRRLETSMMIQLNWNFVHMFLGWFSESLFFFFQNFEICGWKGWVPFPKLAINLRRNLETSMMIRLNWSLLHMFLGWFPKC